MIYFKIHYQNQTHEMAMDSSQTILQVKHNIVQMCHIEGKTIELVILIERPIRCLGKFNLEPGILPMSLDQCTLNRWDLEEKTIDLTFEILPDYVPPENVRKRRKINHSQVSLHSPVSFELDSKVDFPDL